MADKMPLPPRAMFRQATSDEPPDARIGAEAPVATSRAELPETHVYEVPAEPTKAKRGRPKKSS